MSVFRSLLVFCIAVAPVAFFGAPEELDYAFGEGGFARLDVNFGARRLLVRSDGRLVAVGSSQQGIQLDLTVVQILPDGEFDPDFAGGYVRTQLSSTDTDEGRAVVEQEDGKLVVLAERDSSTFTKAVVVRYNEDGSLDGTFGTSGRTTPAISTADVFPKSMVLLPGGKLLLLATVDEGAGREEALVRLNADGSLDTTFQGTGMVRTTLPNGILSSEMFLLNDQSVLTIGRTSTTPELTIVRYSADGSRDATFGTGGVSIKPLPERLSEIENVVRLDDGRFVIGGRPGGLTNHMRVWRFQADGTLDTTFGALGVAIASFGRSSETTSASLRGMAVQPDGKIVVVGLGLEYARYTNFNLPPPNVTFMARFTAEGVLDQGFGQGGLLTRGSAFAERALEVAVQHDGRIVTAITLDELESDPGGVFVSRSFAMARFFGGEGVLPPPPPVFDTTSTVTGEPAGTQFFNFKVPTVDAGQVGGIASIKADGRPQVVIYGGDGSVQARVGGTDDIGAEFLSLGDPVVGGEALGFVATARQPAQSVPSLRLDAALGLDRLFAVRPGGKLVGLYSRLTRAGGIKRLAAQAAAAPGGGQFARFGGFGLPRVRGGLVFTGRLHRSDGVTAKNDFGLWRETVAGGSSDLLLRHGFPVSDSDLRVLKKLVLMTPVANATDQRRSFAPDGSVAAMATFSDGTKGVVLVASDGSTDVPLDSASDVQDEAGEADSTAVFTAFTPPAIASRGKIAFLANLRAAARGLPPPPTQAIFSNWDGTMRRVAARGGPVPGRAGLKFGSLGQPLLGQRGMVGFVAALTGKRVTPANRKALVLNENGVRAVVARLGEQAVGYGPKVTYRRFISAVVTDSDPGRMVFTAAVGGPGVKAAENVGLWSVSPSKGSSLILRKGQSVMVEGKALTVRTFDALQAPKSSIGQGRSTDAEGFVTARVKLSDRRSGVLRIPLP